MKFTQQLLTLGLNKDESTIYETLLNSNDLNILELSNRSGLHRPGLYKLIPNMIKRGLLIEVKVGKRIKYSATSPNNLNTLVESKITSIKSIVEDLNTEYIKNQTIPKVEVYYGKEGVIKVYMDIVNSLDKGDTYYRYSVRGDFDKDYLPSEYRKIRDEKKLERLAITNEYGKTRKKPKLERFVKVLKGSYEVFDVTKLIYKNKVAYVDYENEMGLIIANDRMYEMEKQVFLSLYKML